MYQAKISLAGDSLENKFDAFIDKFIAKVETGEIKVEPE
jgi:hypothetical protein